MERHPLAVVAEASALETPPPPAASTCSACAAESSAALTTGCARPSVGLAGCGSRPRCGCCRAVTTALAPGRPDFTGDHDDAGGDGERQLGRCSCHRSWRRSGRERPQGAAPSAAVADQACHGPLAVTLDASRGTSSLMKSRSARSAEHAGLTLPVRTATPEGPPLRLEDGPLQPARRWARWSRSSRYSTRPSNPGRGTWSGRVQRAGIAPSP